MSKETQAPLTLSEVANHTSEVVAAYVTNHSLDPAGLQELILQTFQTFVSLESQDGNSHKTLEPAVAIANSIHEDYLICLEDGRQLKMLKRHLKSAYNMTPEQYRQRWNLPANYPMVAPNYARKRSHLAKNIGLGTNGRKKGSWNQSMQKNAA